MNIELEDILKYIDKRIEFKMKVTVRDVALHFGLTRQQFTKIFKKHFHVLPKRYIEQREFIFWRHYLAEKRGSGLHEIYQEVGACPRTFFRRIKKFSHQNPKNYREVLYIRAQYFSMLYNQQKGSNLVR